MYSTEAIVLGSVESGEADEMVSFYTKDFGKLSIKVKGSKKSTTKQGNFLHKPSVVAFNFVSARAGYILSGIKSIRDYSAISENIYALAYTSSFLGLASGIFYEGQKDEQTWNLLVSVLEESSDLAEKNAEREQFWKKEKEWLIYLLHILGLKPEKLELGNINDASGIDKYIHDLLTNKLERPIEFFGLRSSFKNHASK
ncbi:MAG: DNA repair protein RecO [Candidatus Spechtbacteria bacterium]|nr:DNA repair protein RecO [Candidatus Spechtbacteria bacterium]